MSAEDYLLRKVEELTAALESEKRAREELESKVRKHLAFTGYDTFGEMVGGRSHGDLCGHQVEIIGRVRHLEEKTSIDYGSLPDAEKEKYESAGLYG